MSNALTPTPGSQPRRIAIQLWVIALTLGAGTGGVLYFRSRGAAPRAPVPARVDQREADLRAAIARTPRIAEPRLALVSHLLATGRKYDALDTAQDARNFISNSPTLRLARAEALAATARLPEAIETIRPLASTDPAARISLADYLTRTGKRNAAVRLLSGLSDPSPEEALRAAQVYLEALHPELAVQRLRPLLMTHAAAVDLPATYGLALLQSRRYAEAAKVLAPAVETAPQLPTLHFYLGSALRLSADLARLAEAEQHLKRATELAPTEPLFHYELALTRVQLRNWPAARTAMEEATILKPDLPEAQRDLGRIYQRVTPPELDRSAVGKARYLLLLQNPRGAMAELEPLYRKAPEERLVARSLALAYHDADRTARSLAVLSDLRVRYPEDQDVLWDLFRAQSAANENLPALATLDQLAAAKPNDLEVLHERADLLQRLKRYPEAEAALTRLRELEPQNAVRYQELGLFQSLWSQRPDRQQLAEAQFRAALRLQPDYVGAHYRLGLLCESSNRPQEAVTHLRRAHELAPELGDALRPLGRAYARLGDRARGDDCFRAYRRFQAQAEQKRRLKLVSSRGRATRESRKRLIQFLLDTGALPEAMRELEVFVHQYPEDSAARQQLALLHGQARRFQLQYEEQSAPVPGRGASK